MSLLNTLTITQEMQTKFESYLYDTDYNQNIKSLFIDGKSNDLNMAKIDIIYPKLRRFILLSILRYKNIFSFDTSIGSMLFTNTVKEYIIHFYKTNGRNVETTVNSNFTNIIINDDAYVSIYDSTEFEDLFFIKVYDKIVFVDVDNNKTTYLNTTFISAVTTYLSNIFITWTDNTKDKFINYKSKFNKILNTVKTDDFLKYDQTYEYKIFDTINNLLSQIFTKSNYLDMINVMYKDDFSSGSINNRGIYDLYSILSNKTSENTDILKIIATGQYLDTFNLRNYNVIELTNIINEIPNIDINYTSSCSVDIDSTNNKINISLSGSTPINIKIKSFEKDYQYDLQSVDSIVKNIQKSYDNTISLKLMNKYNLLASTGVIPHSDIQGLYDELFNHIHDLIYSVNIDDYVNTITESNVTEFVNTNKSYVIFSSVRKYYEAVKFKITDNYETIHEIFKNQMKNYTNLTIKFPFELVNVLNNVTVKETKKYQDYIHILLKYLSFGYLAYDFNERFAYFVSMIQKILEPILTINVPSVASVPSSFIDKIKSLVSSYIGEILPVMYFDIYSNHNIYTDEDILFNSYSKYYFNKCTFSELESTILCGNRAVIYDDSLLQYIIDSDSKKYLLDVDKNNIIYQLTFNDYYVNFEQGTYFSDNDSMMEGLFKRLLDYDLDIMLNSTTFSRFCNHYSTEYYPVSIFKKINDIVLYNYSSFLKFSPGFGYYLNFNFTEFMMSQNIDSIYNSIITANDTTSKYNILVSDVSQSLIKMKPIVYDIDIYTNYYALPITVRDIINGDISKKYIISLTDNIVNTEPIKEWDNYLLTIDYITNKMNKIPTLDILDDTGYNGFHLSYIYRILRTYEKLITNNINDTLQYSIILTGNIYELNKTLSTSDKSNIYNRIVGDYKGVENVK